MPKGILKNRIPTKRSASECVDDLSQIMEDLDLQIWIHDLPNQTSKVCSHRYCFDEEDESKDSGTNEAESNSYLKSCDCNCAHGDSDNNERPKKTVRFDEHVHETVFFASRLYDRRNFSKYHLSSRHHPPIGQHSNKSKKNRQNASKSSSNENLHEQDKIASNSKLNHSNGCKMTKSQRAKQSKKDKKRKLSRKDEPTDTSSDDQGYCSSRPSFSD